jgi:hypothetical protein
VTRWILRGCLMAVVCTGAPGLTYEALEKTAERTGARHGWFHLSWLAERDTRWSPRTGILPLDRALHEFDEAAHFWRLVRSHPVAPYRHGSSLAGSSSSSAR